MFHHFSVICNYFSVFFSLATSFEVPVCRPSHMTLKRPAIRARRIRPCFLPSEKDMDSEGDSESSSLLVGS